MGKLKRDRVREDLVALFKDGEPRTYSEAWRGVGGVDAVSFNLLRDLILRLVEQDQLARGTRGRATVFIWKEATTL